MSNLPTLCPKPPKTTVIPWARPSIPDCGCFPFLSDHFGPTLPLYWGGRENGQNPGNCLGEIDMILRFLGLFDPDLRPCGPMRGKWSRNELLDLI